MLNIESSEQQHAYQKASIYIASLTEEEKEDFLKIDHVLALYLVDLAEHVIVNFFRAAAVFVNLMRDCVNDLAWEKIANYKLLLDVESTDADSDMMNPYNGQEETHDAFTRRPPIFTATKSPCIDSNNLSGVDMIFQLSNEFCTTYLPMKCNVFDRNLSIQLTRHLCMWLSHRGFTQYKISLASAQ